jgi:hypothetical protein
MNQALVDNNYLVIPGFITQERAIELKEWLFKEGNEGRLIQDPRSNIGLFGKAYQDAIPFLELLCEKTNEVSKIIGDVVIPTYSYCMVYETNSKLIRHKDRGACEVSLTLHLGGDAKWPIFVQKPDGAEVSVDLNPGDAMLYLGCVADHWRENFSGSNCGQVFLHYVRSRGPCARFYFDKLK